jgi:hypothetical protein
MHQSRSDGLTASAPRRAPPGQLSTGERGAGSLGSRLDLVCEAAERLSFDAHRPVASGQSESACDGLLGRLVARHAGILRRHGRYSFAVVT